MASRRKKKPHQIERIGTRACPNCNAEARMVVERDKPRTPGWEMYVVCDKCQGKFFVGLISDTYKRRIDRNYQLMKAWGKAKTPAARGKIMLEVKRLGEEETKWEKAL